MAKDETASRRLAEEKARDLYTRNLQCAFGDLLTKLNRAYGQPAGDAADTRSQHVLALLAIAGFLNRMGPDYLAHFADQFAKLAQTLHDREHLVRATSEHFERLLFIMNYEDDPGLSAIDNKRRRYFRILWEMDCYFHEIGHDKLPRLHAIDHNKLPELGTYIANLGITLEDLNRGVTNPLFVKTRGPKRDSMLTWGARLQAALGLECWFLSGLSRKKAASDAARKYKALASLKRGTNRDLKGSLLSWYDRYVEERVPVPELLEAFQTERRELNAAKLSPAEYRKRGEQAFAKAVKTAIQ
jgi:hypothetical protein